MSFFLFLSVKFKYQQFIKLEISGFSLGKFFQKVKIGQKKCPKIEKGVSGLQKHVLTA